MTRRAPNITPAMRANSEFWVVGCRNCHHPGALHVIEQWEPRVTSCRCCSDCPGYEDGEFMRWSLAAWGKYLPDRT